MKKLQDIVLKKHSIVLLILFIIALCVASGSLFFGRTQDYFELNGKNNMATVMEQMVRSYDIQIQEYYKNLHQAEYFLFRDGNREMVLKDFETYFHSVQEERPYKLLFMKMNGETMTTDGTESHIDIQDQMLIDLNQNKNIAQSITMTTHGKKEQYYLIALPCEPYTVNGEVYNVIAALYDHDRIDSLLELNGYGGNAFLFLVDENGIVNYTNQTGDAFYFNYALTKHIKKDGAITEEQYEELRDIIKSREKRVELFDQSDRPFYLGCYPVSASDHSLICIVAKSAVNSDLAKYQMSIVRWLLIYATVVIFFSALILYLVFRTNDANKKALYEEEKQQLMKKAMQELAVERNKANAANRAKSDFLSNMSHDIRTPMNAIVGITNLMAYDKGDPVKMDLHIQKLQMSSHHLLSLINDVLDMSKIESNTVVLNAEPVSLAEQIGQVESIIRPQAEIHGQHFYIRTYDIVHEDLIGDAVRLRQIFINLLSNAVKYTPDGGTISLDVRELPCERLEYAKFRIAVTDNGCGMAPEFLRHIFEPFTRAENSTTNRVQGTGLGMAITKNIVDLMGGTIQVQSEVNQGSCFTVELTFAVDKKETEELSAERILLISDEPLLIQNIRTILGKTSAALKVATCESQTDEILSSTSVDLILLGGSLQGQILPDHIQRLREKTKDAILIYCCEYAEREQVRGMVIRGEVDGLVVRPIFLSNLIHTYNMIRRETAAVSKDGQPVLRGKRFLCAEDNTLNAEILEAILGMEGATCTIYPNGQALLDAFAHVKPGEYDAILMDIQMPVMNGLDATRAIRKSENLLGQSIPIIAMTANAFSDDIQNCLDAGMDAHISKPIDLGVLEKTLLRVAEKK